MTKGRNLQDVFLNKVRKADTPVTVFLVNGYQLRGTVQSYDSFTVLLDTEGKQQMIYKHAISTLVPVKAIPLSELEESAV